MRGWSWCHTSHEFSQIFRNDISTLFHTYIKTKDFKTRHLKLTQADQHIGYYFYYLCMPTFSAFSSSSFVYFVLIAKSAIVSEECWNHVFKARR